MFGLFKRKKPKNGNDKVQIIPQVKEVNIRENENFKDERYCPQCHSKLVLRNGMYGEFYGCSNFPNCRYTESVEPYVDFSVHAETIYFYNHLNILSGKRECFSCKKKTTVSGLVLIEGETINENGDEVDILSWHGYDMYILPWSEIFEKLSNEIQRMIQMKYPIKEKYSKVLKQKYYANVCEHCGCLQGDNYIYFDTGHGSPFDPDSKEFLRLEKIPINTPFNLDVELLETISPRVYYGKRIKY